MSITVLYGNHFCVILFILQRERERDSNDACGISASLRALRLLKKYLTQTQHQRPQSPMVTLTLTSKHKVRCNVCTFYLLVGDPGLCCCICMTSLEM